MKLLVTTPTQLLHVDTTTHQCHLVESHRPGYYGITWDPSGETLMLGHGRKHNATLSGSLSLHEEGWVSAGRRRSPSILSTSNQLLTIDDRIVATESGRGCLTVFRTDDWFYRHYTTDDARGFVSNESNAGYREFNSLYFQKDQLFAIANRQKGRSEIIRFFWPEMEVIQISPIATFTAYNIWVTEEGQQVVCDSTHGRIIDAETGDVLWTSGTANYFTRGLASDGQTLIVGQSAQVSHRKHAGVNSVLGIIDCQTWKTLETVSLPTTSNIHDLRILDRPDLCHHGAIFHHALDIRQAA